MAITQAQKIGIQEVIKLLLDATVPRGKRRLADMFLELVDKDDWPEYYEVFQIAFSYPFPCPSSISNPLPGDTRTEVFERRKTKPREEQVQKSFSSIRGSQFSLPQRVVLQ